MAETLYFNSKLINDIQSRYAMFNREEDGKANTVVDSLFPKYCCIGQAQFEQAISRLPTTSYAISEYISNSLEVRQLPLQYMLEILGFNKRKIKTLLNIVKNKKLKMHMIGFGGTGANTWHWLSKILEWTGTINLFDEIVVYDNDDIAMHNILRFPFDLRRMSSSSTKKINMFSNYAKITRTHRLVATKFQNSRQHAQSFNPVDITSEEKQYFILERRVSVSKTKWAINDESVFFYGAPDLESRELFYNTRFLAATHGNDSCSMTVCPEINKSIQVESYGMIRLNSFFMNQLRMAIGLLEFLASDDENKWEEKGKRIFEFDFKKFIDSGSDGKTEKVIHFQLEHSGNFENV